MKASSSALAMAATKMAFSTNAAGPSLQSLSKMDSIAESQVRIRSALRASLVGNNARNVLPLGEAEAQSASIGLRRESANLVSGRKILRSGGEENISGDLRYSPSRQRKPQPGASRGPPLRARAGKDAACAGGGKRKRPHAWQVNYDRAIQG